MYKRIEKKHELRQIDAVCEIIAVCIVRRSVKPMKNLFGKGSYGPGGCHKGSYLDYMKYRERTGKELVLSR